MAEEIFGTAKDGTRFDANHFAVKACLRSHPDLTLEAAIGNVIMEYDAATKSDVGGAPPEGTGQAPVPAPTETTPAAEVK